MKKNTSSMGFRFVAAGSLSSGAASINLLPAIISSRLGTEADGFSFYRVRSLKFRLHRAPSGANTVSAGYVAGNPNTLPTTQAQISELLCGVVLPVAHTIPTGWATVPRKELAGALPWYKTISGTDAADFEYPGLLVLAGTTTDPYLMEIAGVYEFKDPVATANTPEEVLMVRQLRASRQERARQQARDAVLRVISPTAPGAVPRP